MSSRRVRGSKQSSEMESTADFGSREVFGNFFCLEVKYLHYVYELVRRMLHRPPPLVAIFSKGTTADDFIDDLMDRFFKPACPAPTAPSLAAPPWRAAPAQEKRRAKNEPHVRSKTPHRLVPSGAGVVRSRP